MLTGGRSRAQVVGVPQDLLVEEEVLKNIPGKLSPEVRQRNKGAPGDGPAVTILGVEAHPEALEASMVVRLTLRTQMNLAIARVPTEAVQINMWT